MLCERLTQSLVRALRQGPERKKPWTPVSSIDLLLNVKKKPLSRINGERKKRKVSSVGPSGKWERGQINECLTCIVCLSPFKPMMMPRLFSLGVAWNCIQIVKIIPANLPKVKGT
jgi:hypothetical protein